MSFHLLSLHALICDCLCGRHANWSLTVTGFAFVNVLALPPEITEPPEPMMQTVDGQTIILTCKTFGAPKPIVKWFHGRDELTGNRYNVQKDGSLEIR